MVIEKNRDIAILRSIGFTPRDVSAVFLWQGGIVLLGGIVLGSAAGFLATYGISRIPPENQGHLLDRQLRRELGRNALPLGHRNRHSLCWCGQLIPARRAAKIEPAKIIRESL